MKKATLVVLVVTLTSFMFAGINLTWGNVYSDNDGIMATPSFGVWFDVNDQTAIGWENGVMVSMEGYGPADFLDFRLGYDGGTSLGVNWNWWEGTGTGWGTALGTAIDFGLTDVADSMNCGAAGNAACGDDATAGDWSITVNLGFGF